MVGADFLGAAAGDEVGLEGHELGVLKDGGAERAAASVAEGLALAIGVPVVVHLVVAVVLLKRVVEVTVQPVELWYYTQVNGHLSILIRFIFVACSDGVKNLVEV